MSSPSGASCEFVYKDERSDYQMMKSAGFDNMHQLMRSHGFKNYETESYEAAKALIQSWRDMDRERAWKDWVLKNPPVMEKCVEFEERIEWNPKDTLCCIDPPGCDCNDGASGDGHAESVSSPVDCSDCDQDDAPCRGGISGEREENGDCCIDDDDVEYCDHGVDYVGYDGGEDDDEDSEMRL